MNGDKQKNNRLLPSISMAVSFDDAQPKTTNEHKYDRIFTIDLKYNKSASKELQHLNRAQDLQSLRKTANIFI
jgi:hypothetical protein